MGAGGDFTIINPPSQSCDVSTIPGNPNVIPWFTHQHDAHFDFEEDASGGGFKIMTDLRRRKHPPRQSAPRLKTAAAWFSWSRRRRGRSTSRRWPTWAAYSLALGAAQLLTPEDGNIYASFDNGFLPGTKHR